MNPCRAHCPTTIGENPSATNPTAAIHLESAFDSALIRSFVNTSSAPSTDTHTANIPHASPIGRTNDPRGTEYKDKNVAATIKAFAAIAIQNPCITIDRTDLPRALTLFIGSRSVIHVHLLPLL